MNQYYNETTFLRKAWTQLETVGESHTKGSRADRVGDDSAQQHRDQIIFCENQKNASYA